MKNPTEESEGLPEGSEVVPEWSAGLPEGSKGLPVGLKACLRGLRAYQEALRERADGRAEGRLYFLLLSAILSPCQPQGLHSWCPFFINLYAISHVRLSSISFLLLASSHLFLRDSFHLAPVASSYRNWLVEVQRRF